MRDKVARLGLQPLGSSFRPPTARYLLELESSLGTPLPEDYRAFLAQYGVCTFSDFVTFALPGGPRIDLNVFLGSDPDDAYDVAEVWRGLSERLPEKFLPFALDPFGNGLCIDLHNGAVHFWDHETDLVTPVASSFSAFIAILRRESP